MSQTPVHEPDHAVSVLSTQHSALVVVRHAQSEHHVRGLTGGWTDMGLTELGREQARLLAARLECELGGVPVRLYTSDLQRGLETAAPIAAALGVAAIPEPRLREHNNGAAAGLTLAEAAARFPETYNRLWAMEERPFPGAETWHEFYDRVAAFLDGLPAAGPLPLLVTHGGVIMNIIAWWLRLGPETLQRTWFGAHPASITVLHADETRAWSHRGVERLGDIAHLYGSNSWGLFPLVVR